MICSYRQIGTKRELSIEDILLERNGKIELTIRLQREEVE